MSVHTWWNFGAGAVIIRFIGMDISEQGHERVLGFATCKASNLSREGCGTLIERVLVAIELYNARIVIDTATSIT